MNKIKALFVVVCLVAASFVVGYSTLPKSHETPIAAAPHGIYYNATVFSGQFNNRSVWNITSNTMSSLNFNNISATGTNSGTAIESLTMYANFTVKNKSTLTSAMTWSASSGVTGSPSGGVGFSNATTSLTAGAILNTATPAAYYNSFGGQGNEIEAMSGATGGPYSSASFSFIVNMTYANGTVYLNNSNFGVHFHKQMNGTVHPYVIFGTHGTYSITVLNFFITREISNVPKQTGNYILFNELGLPFGQTWNITLNNKTANVINSLYTTTTEQIKAFLPTGYNYSFLFQTFDSNYYKIINESGHVILPSTSNATVNITLINKTYEAIFTESGLSSGTSWSIKVNNTTTSLTQSSTTTTNKFLLRNGTYDFTVISLVVYTANVTSGSFTINGGNINKYIGYTYTAFNETFHEQGLPKGAVWQLVINGTTYTNNSLGVIYFFGKIGTYTVKALNSSQFTPVNIYNNITITGNNNYTIDYAIYLTFIESGFTGKWSITVDGVLYTSTTNTIVAKVAPGYVSFNVSGKSGYIINPIIETTNISGPTTIDITFSTAPTNYIAALGSIYILFIVVLLGIIFMAYLFVRWRKR